MLWQAMKGYNRIVELPAVLVAVNVEFEKAAKPLTAGFSSTFSFSFSLSLLATATPSLFFLQNKIILIVSNFISLTVLLITTDGRGSQNYLNLHGLSSSSTSKFSLDSNENSAVLFRPSIVNQRAKGS